ncbi:hypothetical protein DFH11DRAFT_1744222 [Phellopilus nigrolimitatus]|nr:hypothetical protein DFH11DRAFT_1744222 [Phellopilus nigrolimitatus]
MGTCLCLTVVALALAVVWFNLRRAALRQPTTVPLEFRPYGHSPALGYLYVYCTSNYVATFSLPQEDACVQRRSISLCLRLPSPPDVLEKGRLRHLKIGLLLENGGENAVMVQFHTIDMAVTELFIPISTVDIGGNKANIRGTVALSLNERGGTIPNPGKIVSACLSVENQSVLVQREERFVLRTAELADNAVTVDK